jgi:hypothetical protein
MALICILKAFSVVSPKLFDFKVLLELFEEQFD